MPSNYLLIISLVLPCHPCFGFPYSSSSPLLLFSWRKDKGFLVNNTEKQQQKTKLIKIESFYLLKFGSHSPYLTPSSKRQEKNSIRKGEKRVELKMLEVILGSIFEKIIEPVIQPVGRHAGFLFHYKRNVNKLDDEVNNLQEQRTNVEGKVNEANLQGDVIDKKVSDWLEDADKTRQEVDKFRGEKTVKENMSCFSFSCPNFISRYCLSKEAERKVVRVKHLTEKGGNIGTVAHPREDPPEVVFRYGGNYDCFHSRDKVFKDIVKALKDPEVNMIGVYGTGGVGKTTMVTKVAEQVKKDGTFDEVVIAVVSQDANVIKIQGQLAARLNLPLSGETDDEVGRASRLWNRLHNGKKNLIILDDVWHELDLKEIGIPITDENKSCKVVLTSRKRDVLKNMDVKDFKIEILCEEESWTLFKKKVGNDVPEIARAVCKKCQGLPVAINAIGAALKDKDIYAWQDALYKLENSMQMDIEGIDKKVYVSLKWSYDRLETEDAKSCFLLCSLFPEDAEIPIDDLVRYYMAGKNIRRDKKPDTLESAFNRVHTVVDTLQSCCLLLDGNYNKDFGNYKKDVVKMHDVVRDVAISIAKDESFLVKHGFSHWPEKATYDHCSVISLKLNDMLEFPNQLVCPELHTLRLDCTENKFQDQLPERFFDGTENLMVLDLNSVTMSPILPASLAKLVKLQMLCLYGCKLGDIAILKDLKDHLEILSLRHSNIEVLPLEVGELTHLRVLDMDSCKELKVIAKGVVSKLSRLEELYMPRTFRQWEGTRADGTGRDISCVSLDELMSLTRLTTLLNVRIEDPALLPKDFTFENLVRFDIAVGESEFYYYKKDSTGVLLLRNFRFANNLEGLLGKPKWCRQRNGLYPSKSFSHLTDLSVTDCSCKYLFSPSLARRLVGLKRLEIERCMDMEGVIGNEGEEDHEDIIPISFSGLNNLRLNNLPNLKSFYPKKEKKTRSNESCSVHDAQTVLFTDKVALPALESLKIRSVPEITEIWDKQIFPIPEKETESSFCHLEYMHIDNCGKLMNVVGGCPKIEAIVAGKEKGKGKEVDHYVTRFPKLTTLMLLNLLSLESFCSRSIQCETQPLFDHQVAFPVLENLIIESVPKVTEIWYKQNFLIPEKETESSFNELRSMEIQFCDKQKGLEPIITEKQKGLEVDDYVTRFPKLTTLMLGNLLNLKSFCSRSIRCEAQPLFDHQVAFPVLKRLNISSLPNITDIWDKKLCPAESFCQLNYLGVFNCSKLVNLVQSTMLPQLRNLQTLRLHSCLMVGGVIDLEKREEETKEVTNNTIVPFPELTSMELGGLQNIKGFCTITSEEQPVNHAQVAFPKLERLEFEKLGEIALRQLLGACEPSIKTLFFFKCDELSTVVSPRLFRRLRNVDLLRVESCIGVTEVFHFDGLEVGEGQECVGSLIQVRKIELNTLPKLTCLWNKDPHGNLCLQNLEYLTIKDCPLLRNLLTASVAKALGGLKALYLRSCSTMEEVVFATDEGHEDVIDDQEIVFPKLEWLILKDLSNLKSFCSANYNFNLPSLQRVVVKRCPNMQTFTSGSVHMPPTLFTTRGNVGPVIEDLNKHLEQQHLEGDQETIEEHEMRGKEDLFSSLYWV